MCIFSITQKLKHIPLLVLLKLVVLQHLTTQKTMAFSPNQSYATAAKFSQNILKNSLLPTKPQKLYLPKRNVHHHKPLYISAVTGFGFVGEREASSRGREDAVQCNAYEARSQPLPISIEFDREAAQKLKIGVYFATWWALSVVFNIYNKKVLNAFPFPWLTSTLSLAAGSLLMLASWAARIAEAPETDLEFWKTLFPVSTIVLLHFPCTTIKMKTLNNDYIIYYMLGGGCRLLSHTR